MFSLLCVSREERETEKRKGKKRERKRERALSLNSVSSGEAAFGFSSSSHSALHLAEERKRGKKIDTIIGISVRRTEAKWPLLSSPSN